jgi:phosphotransferase system  glucose/maltose/N-acetylglucosamine-specific IIC component
MSAEQEQKVIEERFNKILAADLSNAEKSRWMVMILIVAVVATIVFGSYYYVTKKKGEKGGKKEELKTSPLSSAKKPQADNTPGAKIVISSDV